MAVPLFASSLERHHDALIDRISAVVRSGRYVLGPEVEAFERELAAYLGVSPVVGVANGTDAPTIALRAAGGQPGDGAVATDDDDIAERVRRLRFHGSDDKETFFDAGYNSRLDELQAAALRVLLPELDGWNEARRRAASAYEEGWLGDVLALPRTVDGAEHVYHLFVCRHPDADRLAAALRDRGIGARGSYRTPCHRQPGMAGYGGEAL